MTKEYKPAKKQWGKTQAKWAGKFEPEFMQALKEFAQQQTAIQGVKVSQSTILSQDTMLANPWIRQRTKQLIKERKETTLDGKRKQPDNL
jgi:hypothetical protein